LKDVNNNKKRKVNKRKRKKRLALTLFALFSIALLLGLSLTVFFPVKSIKAVGSKLYSSADIVKYSGIKKGDNLLRLSEKNALENIQKNLTFIDEVEIEKSIDGNIVLNVKDAKEVFVYSVEDKLYSTDKTGRILKSYDELPENTLHIICDSKLSEDKLRVEINDAKKQEIIDLISKKVEGFALTANDLDIENSYEIKMVFDNRLKVDFGDISYFEEKLAHFLKMSESEKVGNASGVVDLSQYSPENPSAYFIKDKNEVKN
jgi:cell division septal protein FtsQ